MIKMILPKTNLPCCIFIGKIMLFLYIKYFFRNTAIYSLLILFLYLQINPSFNIQHPINLHVIVVVHCTVHFGACSSSSQEMSTKCFSLLIKLIISKLGCNSKLTPTCIIICNVINCCCLQGINQTALFFCWSCH